LTGPQEESRGRIVTKDEVIGDLVARLTTELGRLDPRLLADHPLEQYMSALHALPSVAACTELGGDIPRWCDAIRQRIGDWGMECFHKLLLLRLILESTARLDSTPLPPSIRALYRENFARLVRNIGLGADPPGFYLHPSFAKELALSTMRLIPCGVLKAHRHGISRRVLLTLRPASLLRVVRVLTWEVGGFRPLYETHLDSRDAQAMLDFRREGLRSSYRRLAELLQVNPDVKGVFGFSWLNDPQLDGVSPNLSFVREVSAEVGGVCFHVGVCDAAGVRDATYMSPVRKKLADEGKYVPKNVLIVVPRARLLAWAARKA
jgi:hypothetical protein